MLVLLQAGVREGMTDVYVAMKRLRRRGRPARLLQDRHKRVAPTFDKTWSDLDRFAQQFPNQVTSS